MNSVHAVNFISFFFFFNMHSINLCIKDEAHYIKEAQTLQSRAACELEGKRRWCLR